MEVIIYKTKQVRPTNTVICEIEKTFMDNYSIVLYDTYGELWIEKFATTYEKATEIAENLFKKIND